jgi:hypothetical protein
MIVNYTEEGWEVITQRAHGLLSALIGAQWKYDVRTKRWTETLLAIAEHDDALVELERDNLLTPQGGPVNFKMKSFEKLHCTRTMDFALSKSRYIALLCSMHLDFVYGKESRENPEAAQFLKVQRSLQKQWRQELNLSLAEAERDYRLLEWCDALSLLLCQHENQPEARTIEISKGPEDISYQLMQVERNVLTVQPWPFETNKFELYFETRLIPQLSFKNAEEFRSAFSKAPIREKHWLFKKESR